VIQGQALKIWRASVWPHQDAAPGTVLAASAQGVDVATGQGVLRLHRLQKAGGKPLEAGEFLRGFALQVGLQFEPKAAA
jgi:methionyl-tRNA formyltransferase